jgi:lipoprotein signal peptidase
MAHILPTTTVGYAILMFHFFATHSCHTINCNLSAVITGAIKRVCPRSSYQYFIMLIEFTQRMNNNKSPTANPKTINTKVEQQK